SEETIAERVGNGGDTTVVVVTGGEDGDGVVANYGFR
ncbi:hypothetical protein A2U01_0062140, partial [Trifolium medium]|nr:hypothetical protein [Trifolium medium]